MEKRLKGLLYFIMTVLIVSATLKVMNWIPQVADKGVLKKYKTVEEATAAVGTEGIMLPLYFPRELIWPPSEIIAGRRPSRVLLMEFEHSARKDVSMVILQGDSLNIRIDEKINIREKKTSSIDLKGRRAVLVFGTCGNQNACSGISWSEGKRKISVLMKSPPEEIIKVAESMIK